MCFYWFLLFFFDFYVFHMVLIWFSYGFIGVLIGFNTVLISFQYGFNRVSKRVLIGYL